MGRSLLCYLWASGITLGRPSYTQHGHLAWGEEANSVALWCLPPETRPAFEGVRFMRWLVEKWLPLRVLICRGQWLTPHSKTNTCEWKTTSQRRQNPSPSGPPEPNTNNWLQHKTHTHYLVRFCSSCLTFSWWLWSCFLPSLCRLPFFRRLVRNTVVWVFWVFFSQNSDMARYEIPMRSPLALLI